MFQQQHGVSDKARQSSELGPTKKEKKNEFFINYWQFALSKYLITKKYKYILIKDFPSFTQQPLVFASFMLFPPALINLKI